MIRSCALAFEPGRSVMEGWVGPLFPVLSQCPVILETSTDWIGAGATLLGAALGAGIASWGAYVATAKASDRRARREKLEAIHAELVKVILPKTEIIHQTWNELRSRKGSLSAVRYIDETEVDLIAFDIHNLDNQVSLYFPAGIESIEEIRDNLLGFATYCNLLRTYPPENVIEDIIKSIRRIRSELLRDYRTLKNALEVELRKIA